MSESITVIFERVSSGAWFATSPDVKNLLVAGMTRADAIVNVALALQQLEDSGAFPFPPQQEQI